MIRYKAISPTATMKDKEGSPVTPYNGRTCGVRFQNNVAIFDDLTVDISLGLSAAQVAGRLVKDFDYNVTQIEESGKEIPFEPGKVEEPAAPRKVKAAA